MLTQRVTQSVTLIDFWGNAYENANSGGGPTAVHDARVRTSSAGTMDDATVESRLSARSASTWASGYGGSADAGVADLRRRLCTGCRCGAGATPPPDGGAMAAQGTGGAAAQAPRMPTSDGDSGDTSRACAASSPRRCT